MSSSTIIISPSSSSDSGSGGFRWRSGVLALEVFVDPVAPNRILALAKVGSEPPTQPAAADPVHQVPVDHFGSPPASVEYGARFPNCEAGGAAGRVGQQPYVGPPVSCAVSVSRRCELASLWVAILLC